MIDELRKIQKDLDEILVVLSRFVDKKQLREVSVVVDLEHLKKTLATARFYAETLTEAEAENFILGKVIGNYDAVIKLLEGTRQ